MITDSQRLDLLERVLYPLPWGAAYLTIEAEHELGKRDAITIQAQPRSGDAPFMQMSGRNLREAIDIALMVEAMDNDADPFEGEPKPG